MYRDNLIANQAKLYLLKQIFEKYLLHKNINDVHLPSAPFKRPFSEDPESLFGIGIEKALRQRDALENLQQKGLIKILSLDDSSAGIHVSIRDLAGLTKLYQELFESIPIKGNLTRIVYSPKSGEGRINGIHFKLNRKSVNRKIFDKLMKSSDLQITRADVWKLTNHRDLPLKNKGSTSDFSSTMSNLRAALNQISPDVLVLNSSHIKIIANSTLTD